jgi:hypothetical protein
MSPRQRYSVLIVAAFLFLATPAFGYFLNGTELKTFIDAADRIEAGRQRNGDFQDSASLRGYVMGVHDAMERLALCVPEGITVAQIVAIVKKYVKDNPEQWNKPANVLVVSALRPTFACKQ